MRPSNVSWCATCMSPRSTRAPARNETSSIAPHAPSWARTPTVKTPDLVTGNANLPSSSVQVPEARPPSSERAVTCASASGCPSAPRTRPVTTLLPTMGTMSLNVTVSPWGRGGGTTYSMEGQRSSPLLRCVPGVMRSLELSGRTWIRDDARESADIDSSCGRSNRARPCSSSLPRPITRTSAPRRSSTRTRSFRKREFPSGATIHSTLPKGDATAVSISCSSHSSIHRRMLAGAAGRVSSTEESVSPPVRP